MAMSLKISEKESRIYHLQYLPYGAKVVKIGPVDPDTLALSEKFRYDTKLVAIATSLEILKKNFRSIIYTHSAFIWCKN